MNTYQDLFTALRNPAMASSIDTPQTKGEWQQFFKQMATLESAQIAQFKNGRFSLHPKQEERVIKQAQAVLDSMSMSLELPVEAPQDEMMTCPNCKGKGRINVEDALGYFGNFLCLTCYGKLKINKAEWEAVLNVQAAPVIEAAAPVVIASPAPVLDATEPFSADELSLISEIFAQDPSAKHSTPYNECPTCGGFGYTTKTNIPIQVQDCPECHGTGEKAPVIASELVTEELPAVDVVGENLYAHTRMLETLELPAIVVEDAAPSDSPSDELPVPNAIEPIDALGNGGFVWHDKLVMPKQYVRINLTGRGMSSGKYELLRTEGKWNVVDIGTGRVQEYHILSELCESVDVPAAKSISLPKPSLLEGLPIAQAIAAYGVADTKAALNEVAVRVVEQSLQDNSAPQLLPEGV